MNKRSHCDVIAEENFVNFFLPLLLLVFRNNNDDMSAKLGVCRRLQVNDVSKAQRDAEVLVYLP